MTKNQFETSIKFIYKGVPRFVRLAYETFIIVEDEIYARLAAARDTNPSTVDRLVENLLKMEQGFNFIGMVDNLMSDGKAFSIKRHIVESMANKLYTDPEFSKIDGNYRLNDEDRFNSIDFGDIIAPVKSMEPVITAFINHSEKFPTVLFDIGKDFTGPGFFNKSFQESSTHIDPFTNVKTIRNSMGQVDAFDNLKTTMRIDINNLMSMFFMLVWKKFVSPGMSIYVRDPGNPIAFFDRYEAIHKQIRNPESMDTIIAEVSLNTSKTAMGTYLVHAGKLCGSKKDVYDWMYTAFVRDSVDQLEKGTYPDSTDISTVAGRVIDDDRHASTPGSTSVTEKQITENDAVQKKVFGDKDDSYNKNLLYKQIRMSYSNWAAVINMITQLSFRRAGDASFNYNVSKYSSDVNGEARRTSIRSDNDILRAADSVLYEYLATQFATYNCTAQPSHSGFVYNSEFMAVSAKRIIDPVSKSIVNEVCGKAEGESRVEAMFNDLDMNDQGILKAGVLTKNILADLFMMCAYLAMLNYTHDHSGSILEQTEPLTGKNKRELFEDIYYSVKNRISELLSMFGESEAMTGIISAKAEFGRDRTFWNNQYTEYSDSIKNAFIAVYAYTNAYSMYNPDVARETMSLFRTISDATEKMPLSAVIDKFKNFNDPDQNAYDVVRDKDALISIARMYSLPPVTNFLKIRLDINWDGINKMMDTPSRYTPSDIFTRHTALFPKNKVVADLSSTIDPGMTRVFASMEDATEVLDTIADSANESTWAHLSYNEIGAIGGAVHDLEDVTSPPADTSDSVAQIGNNVVEKNEVPDPTDAEDEMKIIGSEAYTASIENEKVSRERAEIIDRYDDMFKKIILRK